MKRYYTKSICRLIPGISEPAARELARLLTRLRSNTTGKPLESTLFRVLDAALMNQAARLTRERNRNRNTQTRRPGKRKRFIRTTQNQPKKGH